MIAPRRVKQWSVSAELLVKMTQGIFEVTANDIPEDAKIVGMFVDERNGVIRVLVEHPTFPELLEGWIAPMIDGPKIRRLVEVKAPDFTVETGDVRRRIQLRKADE